MRIQKQDILFALEAFIVSAIFLLLLAPNVSPFFLNSGGDSCVYQQMGQLILSGKVPYLDLFDHKGYLLYCIQAIGLLLNNGHWGIYLLYVINLTICLILWWKTSKLYPNISQSKLRTFLPLMAGLAVYAILIDKGNQTECWSLPYISYALYIYAKHKMTEADVSKLQSLVLGMGMGVIAFLRANNNAPICAILLLLVVELALNKQYKKIFICCLYGFLGFLIVVVSTIAIFVILHGFDNLYHLFYGSFLFNLQYLEKYGKGSIFIQYPFYLSITLLIIMLFTCKKKDVAEIVVIFILTYLTFGKAYYHHYFIVTVPLYVYGTCLVMNAETKKNFLPSCKYIIGGLTLTFCIGLILLAPYIREKVERGAVTERGLREVKSALSEVPSHELDSVWNYNTRMEGMNILQCMGKVQMNRIFYPALLTISDELHEIGTIENIRPLWIMVNENTEWTECMEDYNFIQNNYELMLRCNMKTEYKDNILLYRRKFL